jgi:chemotaxis protein methyltransferase CheR
MTGQSIDHIVMDDSEFALFQKMIYDITGINMTGAKKALVTGRLAKRLKHYGLASYADYFHFLKKEGNGEQQIAVDLLTTNETYFFRESKHFDFLREGILPKWKTGARRIWSAASSSGEEAYTLSMVLSEHCSVNEWDIVGTDICTEVIGKARLGQYPIERTDNIPTAYLKKYCRKGIGSQEGTFVIANELRSRVGFVHANLKSDLTRLGSFDVIFLRNVLIYFDIPTKKQVVENLCRQLKPGGFLFVGHSESLNGITNDLILVAPSVYEKIC